MSLCYWSSFITFFEIFFYCLPLGSHLESQLTFMSPVRLPTLSLSVISIIVTKPWKLEFWEQAGVSSLLRSVLKTQRLTEGSQHSPQANSGRGVCLPSRVLSFTCFGIRGLCYSALVRWLRVSRLLETKVRAAFTFNNLPIGPHPPRMPHGSPEDRPPVKPCSFRYTLLSFLCTSSPQLCGSCPQSPWCVFATSVPENSVAQRDPTRQVLEERHLCWFFLPRWDHSSERAARAAVDSHASSSPAGRVWVTSREPLNPGQLLMGRSPSFFMLSLWFFKPKAVLCFVLFLRIN